MLSHASRHQAIELLIDTNLFSVVFPAITDEGKRFACRILPFLSVPRFEPSLASLLLECLNHTASRPRSRTAEIASACRAFKLSNEETSTVCWLCDSFNRCRSSSELPLHELKPLLADDRQELLLDVIEASARAELRPQSDIDFLNKYLKCTSTESLNPPPLISGSVLKSLGMETGPEFSTVLRQIRNDQLDELISTSEEAIARVKEMLTSGDRLV